MIFVDVGFFLYYSWILIVHRFAHQSEIRLVLNACRNNFCQCWLLFVLFLDTYSTLFSYLLGSHGRVRVSCTKAQSEIRLVDRPCCRHKEMVVSLGVLFLGVLSLGVLSLASWGRCMLEMPPVISKHRLWLQNTACNFKIPLVTSKHRPMRPV